MKEVRPVVEVSVPDQPIKADGYVVVIVDLQKVSEIQAKQMQGSLLRSTIADPGYVMIDPSSSILKVRIQDSATLADFAAVLFGFRISAITLGSRIQNVMSATDTFADLANVARGTTGLSYAARIAPVARL